MQVYNDPIIALSEFKRDFYDLLLVDINMPKMNGFEFAKAVLALDVNVKLCFYVLGTYKSGGIERIMSGCRDRMFHNKARDFG